MNPLLPAVIQLSLYVSQIEAQISELHRQLLEKSTEFDRYREANPAYKDKPNIDLQNRLGEQLLGVGEQLLGDVTGDPVIFRKPA